MANLARDALIIAEAKGFTEIIGRGRGYLITRNPTTGKFASDTSIGNAGWHYGAGLEVDTAWVASTGLWNWESTRNDYHYFVRDSVPVSYRYVDAITGHYVEITWNAVQWVNDEGQSENATAFSQVAPVINDDVITWNNIAVGWNVRLEAQPMRLVKWLTINSLAELGTPSIGGTNIRLRFRLSFQRSSGLDIYVNNVRWAEANNTWAETNSNIEFRDTVSGLPVFWFKAPIGHDAGGLSAPMLQRVRRTGNNIYSEIDTLYSWLQSAVYPIRLDDTIDPKVGTGSDDAHQESVGMNTVLDSFAPWIRDNPGAGYNKYFGYRVTVTGPASGATIDVAYGSLYFATATIDVSVDIQDADDPDTFTNSVNNLTNRTLTGNPVTWTVTGNNNEQNTSPSLVTPMQAVINRAGWVSGNQMVVVLTARSTTVACNIWTYEMSTIQAPSLHIEYTVGGTNLLSTIKKPIIELSKLNVSYLGV